MSLKPVKPGLRRFVYDSNDVGKVELRVPPGDEIEVSDEVAAQLERDPHWKPAGRAAVTSETLPPPPARTAKKAAAKRA